MKSLEIACKAMHDNTLKALKQIASDLSYTSVEKKNASRQI